MFQTLNKKNKSSTRTKYDSIIQTAWNKLNVQNQCNTSFNNACFRDSIEHFGPLHILPGRRGQQRYVCVGCK